MPGQTFVDLTLNFTLNLNDANENYMYNTFRNWYKLIYDPLTGEMGLKKDYVGSMIVVQFNRAGDIFRKITLKDVFPTAQPDFVDELNYETLNQLCRESPNLKSKISESTPPESVDPYFLRTSFSSSASKSNLILYFSLNLS